MKQFGGTTLRSISRQTLEDKIRGAWVGKSYGAVIGEPVEFRFQGEINEDPLPLKQRYLKEVLPNEDDLYMNMALLKAVATHGLDASAADFAQEFIDGAFLIWHANGQGRQNLLAGVPPKLAGYPVYSPHADDVDFQIECDFIGMISPGLPEAAQEICDQAGHVMNYGDGVYGGVFLAAMYAAAFFEDDMRQVVEFGHAAIPADSGYGNLIGDVLHWHEQYPGDWRATWQEIEDKWNHDSCPWGPTGESGRFNIQARINGAYIALGLLYGEGDFEKSIEITTRAGQDTDGNAATTGGIVATSLGFSQLPAQVRAEMSPYMERPYNFSDYSVESATGECLRLAIANVKANGGTDAGDELVVKTQPFRFTGPTEVSFPTLEPIDAFKVTDDRLVWKGAWEQVKRSELLSFSSVAGDALEVAFTGNIIFVQGDLHYDMGILEAIVDGELMQTRDMYLPKRWRLACQSTAVWITDLPDGEHKLQVRVSGRKNPQSEGTGIGLGRVVSYRGEVAPLPGEKSGGKV